jgi:hypothetical protein
MIKSLLTFGILLAFGISSCGFGGSETNDDSTADPFAELEKAKPNDAGTNTDVSENFSNALEIEHGETTGNITSGDPGDAYILKNIKGDGVLISVTPDKHLDVSLTIDFLDGVTKVLRADDGLKGYAEHISFTTDANSDRNKFGILVSHVNGLGNYTINVISKSQNDGNSGGDAPQDINNPLLLPPGTYTDNYLCGGDRWDDYAFYLATGQTLVLTVEPEPSLDIVLDFPKCFSSDPTNCVYASHTEWQNNGGKGQLEAVTFTAKFTAEFAFHIGKMGTTCGKYKMTATVE